jgi:hypothetical protein
MMHFYYLWCNILSSLFKLRDSYKINQKINKTRPFAVCFHTAKEPNVVCRVLAHDKDVTRRQPVVLGHCLQTWEHALPCVSLYDTWPRCLHPWHTRCHTAENSPRQRVDARQTSMWVKPQRSTTKNGRTCGAKGRTDDKGLAHDTLASGASSWAPDKGLAHGTLDFGPTTWLHRRPVDVSCFALSCVYADVHGKCSLSWPSLLCGFCAAQTHGKVFAVC